MERGDLSDVDRGTIVMWRGGGGWDLSDVEVGVSMAWRGGWHQ